MALTTTKPRTQRVVLPPLHAGQQDIADSEARFKVVVCGRRYGKTTLGIWKSTKGALEKPGIYWWVGPNYPSIAASAAWPTLKRLLQPINGVTFREAERYATLPNGSEIWIKSADNPDTLRGSKLRGVVLDEFAQIKEETWTEVLRPALSDLRGWALFIGTPKGKNWAYRLFEAAKIRPGWACWQKPTIENPYIDPGEIEDARQDMSEESFKQEYEADFGASQYLVYPEILPEIHEWRAPLPDFVTYHGGMDFGGDSIGAHASVTIIGGRTSQDDLILFECFKQSGPNIAERQLNWTLEREHEINSRRRSRGQMPVKGPVYRADKSQALGIQFMKRFGLRVYPTKGGPDSVTEGIELVHRRLKPRPDPVTGMVKPKLYVAKGTPHILEDLMAYRYEEPRPDKENKNRPLKINDDVADTVRYLVEGVDLIPIGDPQQLYSKSLPRLRNG